MDWFIWLFFTPAGLVAYTVAIYGGLLVAMAALEIVVMFALSDTGDR